MSNTLYPAIASLALTMIIAILGSQMILHSAPLHSWQKLIKELPLKGDESEKKINMWTFPSTQEQHRALASSTPWFNPDFLINVSKVHLNEDPIVFELPSADELYFDIEMMDSSGRFIRNFGTAEGPVESSDYLVFGPNTRNRSIAGISKVNVEEDLIYLITRVRIFDMQSLHIAQTLNQAIQLLQFEDVHWGSKGRNKDTPYAKITELIPEKQKFVAYQERLQAEKVSGIKQKGKGYDISTVNDNGWGKNTKSTPLNEVRAELELLGLDPDAALTEKAGNDNQKFRTIDPAYYSPTDGRSVLDPRGYEDKAAGN